MAEIQVHADKEYIVKGSTILLCKALLEELKYRDAAPLVSRFVVIGSLEEYLETEVVEACGDVADESEKQ